MRPWTHLPVVVSAFVTLCVTGPLRVLAAQQEPVPMRVADAVSAERDLNDLLPLADSSWLAGGMFLADGQVALLEGATQRVYFINTVTGTVVATGGPEYDPGPVTALLERLPEGGVATINADRTLVFFRADGLVMSTASVEVDRATNVVGLFSDRTLTFRKTTGAAVTPWPDVDGPVGAKVVRQKVDYHILQSSGETPGIATAQGDEAVIVSVSGFGQTSSRRLRTIFGHETFDDLAGDILIVAQSDADEILLVDVMGRLKGRIRMPPRRVYKPTQADVEAQRAIRLMERRRATRAQQRALSGNERFASMAKAMASADSLLIWKATGNSILPPIDRLITDVSNRLWVRITALPHELIACWQVWDLSDLKLVNTVAMPRSAQLLDSRDDKVLLLLVDQDDNHHRIVTRIMVPLDPSEIGGAEACSPRYAN